LQLRASLQAVWDILQQPLHEAEAPDALIIETSGVADPRMLIAMLERKFGQLPTRTLPFTIIFCINVWLSCFHSSACLFSS
jgi:G3E family GTPase